MCFTDAYPVELFTGKVSPSGTSFAFSWSHPSIGASITTSYNLIYIPLLLEIPSPNPILLSSNTTSAVLTGLHPGVGYNCSIYTATTNAFSQPQTLYLRTPEKGAFINVFMQSMVYPAMCLALSGTPVMLTAVTGKRQVLFSWSPPPVTQHNGVLTNYTISCSPSPSSLPQSLSHQNTSTTVAGFSPNTLYTCSVAAWNTQGSGPSAYTTFTTLEDCNVFLVILTVSHLILHVLRCVFSTPAGWIIIKLS